MKLPKIYMARFITEDNSLKMWLSMSRVDPGFLHVVKAHNHSDGLPGAQ